MQDNLKEKIAIIGLGYVGLPLAVEFSKKFEVVGFDINDFRIKELQNGYDSTFEITKESLFSSLDKSLFLSSNIAHLGKCSIFIITVPTPIDDYKTPDLTPLIKATQTVGTVLKSGDVVIYESTVYPGCTEEVCVPILELSSKLVFNKDFFCGYSPERINPGDKEHTLTKIKKVTSGSTPDIAKKIDQLYSSIIEAGTHLAPSIKVAEAAKVIENSQRDINIAFVNELAKIFNLLNISTTDVLNAASTKWNFLNFKPGLVGGHCIGVDPYYLAQKAQTVGYHPEIILAGRRVNDSMGSHIANQVIKLMLKKKIVIEEANILVLGITFKENCPDIRNTKVIDIINELKSYNTNITTYDPWASPKDVAHEYGLVSTNTFPSKYKFHAVLIAVGHDEFLKIDFKNLLEEKSVLYDVKGILEGKFSDGRL